MSSPAPRCEPEQREPAEIAPADSYRRGDQVWVHRHGQWHTGVVDGSSPAAVIVTYQPQGMRGTVVDTVPAMNLIRRDAPVTRAGFTGGER